MRFLFFLWRKIGTFCLGLLTVRGFSIPLCLCKSINSRFIKPLTMTVSFAQTLVIIPRKSLLICPANSLKFSQTFLTKTCRSLHYRQNPLSWILLSLGKVICFTSLSQIFVLTYSSSAHPKGFDSTLTQNPLELRQGLRPVSSHPTNTTKKKYIEFILCTSFW